MCGGSHVENLIKTSDSMWNIQRKGPLERPRTGWKNSDKRLEKIKGRCETLEDAYDRDNYFENH